MNKQELIEKYKELENSSFDIAAIVVCQLVLKDLEQLDEPKPVKVPQCVAEYIEFKKKNNFHVYGAMRVIEDHYDKKVPDWFYENNIEKFCLAWLDGYEVEEEKRYLVTLKNRQPLVKSQSGSTLYFSQDITARNYKGTQKELEEANFGWVFDCEGIDIEEVE
ncbi:phage protein [Streptococcus pneumoniae]|nr:phage protein [Streptococcus pneumoniae]